MRVVMSKVNHQGVELGDPRHYLRIDWTMCSSGPFEVPSTLLSRLYDLLVQRHGGAKLIDHQNTDGKLGKSVTYIASVKENQVSVPRSRANQDLRVRSELTIYLSITRVLFRRTSGRAYIIQRKYHAASYAVR